MKPPPFYPNTIHKSFTDGCFIWPRSNRVLPQQPQQLLHHHRSHSQLHPTSHRDPRTHPIPPINNAKRKHHSFYIANTQPSHVTWSKHPHTLCSFSISLSSLSRFSSSSSSSSSSFSFSLSSSSSLSSSASSSQSSKPSAGGRGLARTAVAAITALLGVSFASSENSVSAAISPPASVPVPVPVSEPAPQSQGGTDDDSNQETQVQLQLQVGTPTAPTPIATNITRTSTNQNPNDVGSYTDKNDNLDNNNNDNNKKCNETVSHKDENSSSRLNLKHKYKYVLCGAGVSAYEALKVIMESDPMASVLVAAPEIQFQHYNNSPLYRFLHQQDHDHYNNDKNQAQLASLKVRSNELHGIDENTLPIELSKHNKKYNNIDIVTNVRCREIDTQQKLIRLQKADTFNPKLNVIHQMKHKSDGNATEILRPITSAISNSDSTTQAGNNHSNQSAPSPSPSPFFTVAYDKALMAVGAGGDSQIQIQYNLVPHEAGKVDRRRVKRTESSMITDPWIHKSAMPLVAVLRSFKEQKKMIRALTQKLQTNPNQPIHITVVGAGWVGLSVAMGLVAKDNIHVTLVTPDAAPLSRYLPRYLIEYVNKELKAMHIDLIPYSYIRYILCRDNTTEAEVYVTKTFNGLAVTSFRTDFVALAPTFTFANSSSQYMIGTSRSSLESDPIHGGLVSNGELSVATDVYACGDAVSVRDESIGGKRRRVQSLDHALESGRHAGRNMVGQDAVADRSTRGGLFAWIKAKPMSTNREKAHGRGIYDHFSTREVDLYKLGKFLVLGVANSSFESYGFMKMSGKGDVEAAMVFYMETGSSLVGVILFNAEEARDSVQKLMIKHEMKGTREQIELEFERLARQFIAPEKEGRFYRRYIPASSAAGNRNVGVRNQKGQVSIVDQDEVLFGPVGLTPEEIHERLHQYEQKETNRRNSSEKRESSDEMHLRDRQS